MINHHGSTFALSVVSACSGVNGVVGFLLVGSAFAAIVRGPIVRKMLWLAGGMALLWVINLVRITFIFFAGKEWGEAIAINVFHPFIGLVTFSLGVVAMILLIKPLGMHVHIGEGRPSPSRLHRTDSRSVAVRPARPPQRKRCPWPCRRCTWPWPWLVVAALVLGISNFGLRAYNLVAGVTGEAKLTAFVRYPIAPPGWAFSTRPATTGQSPSSVTRQSGTGTSSVPTGLVHSMPTCRWWRT